MRILCDMDSVIVNLLGKWLAVYNAEYNDCLTPGDISSWDTHLVVKPECGLKMYDYLKQPGFFADLEPLPGAIDTLRRLVEEDEHELILVTAAPDGSASDKIDWVGKHMPFIDKRKDVITCYHKYMVQGDVLIDDSPKNIKQYRETWPEAHVCTIAYPYNEAVKHHASLYAQDGLNTKKAWAEIYKYIVKVNEGR